MSRAAEPIIDYAQWETRLGAMSATYKGAEPFPFIVSDGFLSETALRDALRQFPSMSAPKWTHYAHVNERKLARSGRDVIPSGLLRIVDELNSERFVGLLTRLTQVSGLVPDPSLEGDGLQMVTRGGFLNIHTDFTAHP